MKYNIPAMREEALKEVCGWKDWQILAAAPSRKSGEKMIAIKDRRAQELARTKQPPHLTTED